MTQEEKIAFLKSEFGKKIANSNLFDVHTNNFLVFFNLVNNFFDEHAEMIAEVMFEDFTKDMVNVRDLEMGDKVYVTNVW